ncbi:TPA: hypothetical protein ROX88_003804 [Bacillus pseudomycoides]|nr:hypothetical protein [Bacillus pseudomycoides]
MYPYNHSYYVTQNISKNLKGLIGTNVRINLGGPEKGEGTLLKIQSDFCVLQSNDGVVYYPLHHINGFAKQSSDESEESDKNEQEKEEPILVGGNYFGSVIDRLKGETIQLNHGPKNVEGIVAGRSSGHILLDIDGQITYVPMFHVQSMRWNYNNDSNNENEKKNKKEDKSRNQNRNRDDRKAKKYNRCEKRR